MAITCKWDKILGTAKLKYNDGTCNNITFYSGGNCLTCICYENKNLHAFIIDDEHAKNMYDCQLCMENLIEITLFSQKEKEMQRNVEKEKYI